MSGLKFPKYKNQRSNVSLKNTNTISLTVIWASAIRMLLLTENMVLVPLLAVNAAILRYSSAQKERYYALLDTIYKQSQEPLTDKVSKGAVFLHRGQCDGTIWGSRGAGRDLVIFHTTGDKGVWRSVEWYIARPQICSKGAKGKPITLNDTNKHRLVFALSYWNILAWITNLY